MTASTATPLKSPQLLAWVTAIAVVLFCVAGVAALTGWMPDSFGVFSGRPQALGDAKTSLKSVPVVSAGAKAASLKSARNAAPVAFCARCGVIVAMRDIIVPDGGGLGVAGGAVVGALLLGRQLGGGHGGDVATLAGAVGGASLGNGVENRIKTTQAREITVLLDDGATTVLRLADAAAWHTGDHVKIIAGVMHRN